MNLAERQTNAKEKGTEMELEKLRNILVEILDCDPDQVTPEASFKDDLGADSIDLVELQMALEDETGLTIEEEQLLSLQTVQDVMDFVRDNA